MRIDQNINYFYINGFELSLALKQRLVVTRKWEPTELIKWNAPRSAIEKLTSPTLTRLKLKASTLFNYLYSL